MRRSSENSGFADAAPNRILPSRGSRQARTAPDLHANSRGEYNSRDVGEQSLRPDQFGARANGVRLKLSTYIDLGFSVDEFDGVR